MTEQQHKQAVFHHAVGELGVELEQHDIVHLVTLGTTGEGCTLLMASSLDEDALIVVLEEMLDETRRRSVESAAERQT